MLQTTEKRGKLPIFFSAVIKTSMQNPKNIAQKENFQPIKVMKTNKQISYKTLLCNSKHVKRIDWLFWKKLGF